jgi:hypothetical protein
MDKSLESFSKLCIGYVAAIAFAFLCALLGCSDSEIPVARVHGTITIDGKPLAGGRVMFAPQPGNGNINPGKPAYGRLDNQGRFELSTFGDGDGAVIGSHLVTITAPRDATPGKKPLFRSLMVPSPYAVSAVNDNELDISLSADDVAKYSR